MYDLEKIDKPESKKELRMEMDAMMARPNLPYLSFTAKELPEIRGWKVGEEYNLEIKVRMTSFNEHKSLDEKTTEVRSSFDVIGVGVDSMPEESDD